MASAAGAFHAGGLGSSRWAIFLGFVIRFRILGGRLLLATDIPTDHRGIDDPLTNTYGSRFTFPTVDLSLLLHPSLLFPYCLVC